MTVSSTARHGRRTTTAPRALTAGPRRQAASSCLRRRAVRDLQRGLLALQCQRRASLRSVCLTAVLSIRAGRGRGRGGRLPPPRPSPTQPPRGGAGPQIALRDHRSPRCAPAPPWNCLDPAEAPPCPLPPFFTFVGLAAPVRRPGLFGRPPAAPPYRTPGRLTVDAPPGAPPSPSPCPPPSFSLTGPSLDCRRPPPPPVNEQSEVAGSEVAGSEVAGSEVAGLEVAGSETAHPGGVPGESFFGMVRME